MSRVAEAQISKFSMRGNSRVTECRSQKVPKYEFVRALTFIGAARRWYQSACKVWLLISVPLSRYLQVEPLSSYYCSCQSQQTEIPNNDDDDDNNNNIQQQRHEVSNEPPSLDTTWLRRWFWLFYYHMTVKCWTAYTWLTKKLHTKLMAIVLSNFNQFTKFFYWRII